MCDQLETEPEVDYSTSVFNDNLEIFDSSLLDSKLGDTCTGVPGRLLGKSQFYLDVNASQYIVQTIESGYELVFINDTPPPTFMKRNNLSALNQSDYVYNEFLRLEKLRCFRRVDYVPHIVETNPLD